MVRSGFTITLPPLSNWAFARLARIFQRGEAVMPPAEITVLLAMESAWPDCLSVQGVLPSHLRYCYYQSSFNPN